MKMQVFASCIGGWLFRRCISISNPYLCPRKNNSSLTVMTARTLHRSHPHHLSIVNHTRIFPILLLIGGRIPPPTSRNIENTTDTTGSPDSWRWRGHFCARHHGAVGPGLTCTNGLVAGVRIQSDRVFRRKGIEREKNDGPAHSLRCFLGGSTVT